MAVPVPVPVPAGKLEMGNVDLSGSVSKVLEVLRSCTILRDERDNRAKNVGR